jgi:hypothetical protein
MDWKKTLGAIAPVIGTALGGPFGGLAGTVLGSFLGVDDPTDDKALESAMNKAMADPNQVMKLKEAELAFKAKMKELDIREEDLHAHDRQSARNMQVATRSKIPGMLAMLVTVGFFGLLGFMCYKDLPTANENALNIMLGSLGTAWIMVVTFYFGSSKGSQDKTMLDVQKKQ